MVILTFFTGGHIMFRKMKWFVAMLLVLGICTDAVLAELIGYWPFDEGQGTEASDITGNGNDGTLNGEVEWVPGYKDSAVRFDTTGERVVVGPLDPTAENNAMTLAAWINWEGQGHTIAHQGIIGKRLGWDPGTGVKWFWETTPAGDLVFRGDNAGGGTGLWWGNGILTPYANQWTHVALTWDDGAAVQYINGEVVESGNITFRDTADDTPVTIGCVDSTNNETFVGSIDEARIYNHALTQPEIQTIMLGIFSTAFSPNPADGAIHPDTWVSLSWKAGDSAASHDVYFGENFDDVNDGTGDSFVGNQLSMFFVVGFPGFPYPEGLVNGTTYYWRIDEVEADGTTKHKGSVWSFTVPPKTAYNPDPADGAESIDPEAELRWTAGFGAKLHYVYIGNDYDEVKNATGGLPQGTTTYDPGPLKFAKTYYWRVDEFDATNTYTGEVWSFTTQGAVGNPSPSNGAVDVKQTAILGWAPGAYAATHQVYLGTDEEAVRNADTGSPEYKGTKTLGSESFDPGKLELDTTYYWRIDEVNDANPDSPWIGNIWSFTTADFIVVDDFEDYDSGEKQIWYFWKDGLGYGTMGTDPYYPGNGSGSAVGDETTASYTEETIVHGGSQAMPLFYDNNKQGFSKYSEAELALTDLRDWTEGGVNTLTIWFRGNPTGFVEAPAGTFTMSAAGVDIWGTADEFRYAYKQLAGAGSIVAQVLSVQNTDPWAKAGVMIRESLDPGSKFAFVCITPGNGCRFQGRLATGIDATSDTSVVTTEQTAITAPYWVRLDRDAAGNFNGYYSSDGVTWQAMSWNPQSITMPPTVYIGLALTSHSSGVTCVAGFSDVQTTGTVSPLVWTQEAIGADMASNDPEQMYVALNGNAVVYNDNPNASLVTDWTEWNIDLQAFADLGVNLTKVNTIALGLGDKNNPQPGGSGTVYFDDIRLYTPIPAP
jgi:hypothetical protein